MRRPNVPAACCTATWGPVSRYPSKARPSPRGCPSPPPGRRAASAVGSRRRGRLRRIAPGSVAHACARRAECPVVPGRRGFHRRPGPAPRPDQARCYPAARPGPPVLCSPLLGSSHITGALTAHAAPTGYLQPRQPGLQGTRYGGPSGPGRASLPWTSAGPKAERRGDEHGTGSREFRSGWCDMSAAVLAPEQAPRESLGWGATAGDCGRAGPGGGIVRRAPGPGRSTPPASR